MTGETCSTSQGNLWKSAQPGNGICWQSWRTRVESKRIHFQKWNRRTFGRKSCCRIIHGVYCRIFWLLCSSCSCLTFLLPINFSNISYRVGNVQLNFCSAWWYSSVHVPPLEQGFSSHYLLLHGWFTHALRVLKKRRDSFQKSNFCSDNSCAQGEDLKQSLTLPNAWEDACELC